MLQGAQSHHLNRAWAACQPILGLFNCTESLLQCLLVSAESWLQGIPPEELLIANEQQVFGCAESLEENWECIVEIQGSLPVAGSERGCITRVCVSHLTRLASHLAQNCMSSVGVFLLIVNFFFVERQECALEKKVLFVPFTKAQLKLGGGITPPSLQCLALPGIIS